MKSTVHPQHAADSQVSAAMDVNEALQRLGDDQELLREIMQIYLEDAPALVERIHASAGSSDATALRRAAHSLRGLASTLSAYEVVSAISRLEHLGEPRNVSDESSAIRDVDARVAELNDAVEHFLRRK
jgi:HPt (histidine-containing phosphotransfer) domain-containing protein